MFIVVFSSCIRYVKSSPKPSSSRSTATSTSTTTPTTSTLNRRQSPTRLDEETKLKVFNSNNDNDHNNSKRGWDNNAMDNCPTSPLLETADGTRELCLYIYIEVHHH